MRELAGTGRARRQQERWRQKLTVRTNDEAFDSGDGREVELPVNMREKLVAPIQVLETDLRLQGIGIDPHEDQVAASAKQALRHPHHLAGRRAMNETILIETGRAVGGGRYGPLAPERDMEDRIGRLTEARPVPTRGE